LVMDLVPPQIYADETRIRNESSKNGRLIKDRI
jgi:hypothetical protein